MKTFLKTKYLLNWEGSKKLSSLINSVETEFIDLLENMSENYPKSGVHVSMDFNEETQRFLDLCTPHYYWIGIRRKIPDMEKKGYKWGLEFSAFGDPIGKGRASNGWPAIWKAAHKVGIHSCGNTHQYQIDNRLKSGLYKNYKGEWYKHLEL